MKLILATVLLSSLGVPVLAMQSPSDVSSFDVLYGADGLIDRRSGLCPPRNTAAREGSTCGGV